MCVGTCIRSDDLWHKQVSLVAILDADKEGFLRSDKSLIQTIGRASRHVNGTVILYCERVTSSMSRAIGETDRRRALQEKYNTDHGKIPQPLVKGFHDGILEAVQGMNSNKEGGDDEIIEEKPSSKQYRGQNAAERGKRVKRGGRGGSSGSGKRAFDGAGGGVGALLQECADDLIAHVASLGTE